MGNSAFVSANGQMSRSGDHHIDTGFPACIIQCALAIQMGDRILSPVVPAALRHRLPVFKFLPGHWSSPPLSAFVCGCHPVTAFLPGRSWTPPPDPHTAQPPRSGSLSVLSDSRCQQDISGLPGLPRSVPGSAGCRSDTQDAWTPCLCRKPVSPLLFRADRIGPLYHLTGSQWSGSWCFHRQWRVSAPHNKSVLFPYQTFPQTVPGCSISMLLSCHGCHQSSGAFGFEKIIPSSLSSHSISISSALHLILSMWYPFSSSPLRISSTQDPEKLSASALFSSLQLKSYFKSTL